MMSPEAINGAVVAAEPALAVSGTAARGSATHVLRQRCGEMARGFQRLGTARTRIPHNSDVIRVSYFGRGVERAEPASAPISAKQP